MSICKRLMATNRVILAIVLLGVSLGATSGSSEVFERRGFALGVGLSEFRATPFPDKDMQSLQDEENKEVFVFCSNDEPPEDYRRRPPPIYLDPKLEKAGVIECRHYYHYSVGDSEWGKSIEEATLLALEWGTETKYLFYQPQGKPEPVLFKIISTAKSPIFQDLLQAYSAKMGAKPKLRAESVQNRFGAKFENEVAVWENATSKLELEKYYSDLDTLAISLTYKPVSSEVEKMLRSVQRDRSADL